MVLLIIGKSAALIVGALAIAALFCWLCWSAFKLVRHPEIGVPLCLAGLLLAWGRTFTDSAFLCIVAVDVALGAAVLWPLGLAWRRRLEDRRGGVGGRSHRRNLVADRDG